MDELEEKVLDLSEKVYENTATSEEREEFFKLLKELMADVKSELDK